jgi:hypothetical protein
VGSCFDALNVGIRSVERKTNIDYFPYDVTLTLRPYKCLNLVAPNDTSQRMFPDASFFTRVTKCTAAYSSFPSVPLHNWRTSRCPIVCLRFPDVPSFVFDSWR